SMFDCFNRVEGITMPISCISYPFRVVEEVFHRLLLNARTVTPLRLEVTVYLNPLAHLPFARFFSTFMVALMLDCLRPVNSDAIAMNSARSRGTLKLYSS